MIFLRQKGTVLLPRIPKGRSIQKWAMEVQKTLQQLRDRGVEAPPARTGGRGTSTGSSTAFYRQYTADVSGTDHYFLQGGQLTGGTGNKTIADIDMAAVGSEPADGTKFWIEITGDGITDSGILLPGFNVTAAAATSASQSGATLPANTLPTASAATGKKFHLLLGSWQSGVFTASVSGHVGVSNCLGTYNVSRF